MPGGPFFYSDYKGMLKASFLASCSDDIVKIYSQLEHDIIKDIVKRLGRLGKIESYTAWQQKIYQEIGGIQKDISGYLSLYEKQAADKIAELFEISSKMATANDKKMFNIAKRELSANEKQILESTFAKIEDKSTINKTYHYMTIKHASDETFQKLQRLTMTVATTESDKFINAANQAFMKVSSGALTWDDAFKDAVNSLAKDGIETVEYTDSGKVIHRSIESAVRSNIMTGINQNASEITLSNCEDLGTDLVEVSAHLGARDQDRDGRPWANHAELQGKVYCLNGEREYVDADGERRFAPNFYSTCGIGEPDGICGINCRHSYYPYFEGTELQYSDGELDEMKDNLVPYVNSKGEETEITQYEAEQMLRFIERNIRNWKRDSDALIVTGFGETPEGIEARSQIRKWQTKAKELVEETGIKRDYTREYIGTSSEKQPTAKGYKKK